MSARHISSALKYEKVSSGGERLCDVAGLRVNNINQASMASAWRAGGGLCAHGGQARGGSGKGLATAKNGRPGAGSALAAALDACVAGERKHHNGAVVVLAGEKAER